MKKLYKNKKGSWSLTNVVLVLIFIITFIGVLEWGKLSVGLNEIQSIMDIEGVTAIRTGVDVEELRTADENPTTKFKFNKSEVITSYKGLIRKRFNSSKMISDYRFDTIKIEAFNENWGLGANSKARPQVVLDSTMVLTIPSSMVFDTIDFIQGAFYRSRSNSTFQIAATGNQKDGFTEVIVRSVSRLYYK